MSSSEHSSQETSHPSPTSESMVQDLPVGQRKKRQPLRQKERGKQMNKQTSPPKHNKNPKQTNKSNSRKEV